MANTRTIIEQLRELKRRYEGLGGLYSNGAVTALGEALELIEDLDGRNGEGGMMATVVADINNVIASHSRKIDELRATITRHTEHSNTCESCAINEGRIAARGTTVNQLIKLRNEWVEMAGFVPVTEPLENQDTTVKRPKPRPPMGTTRTHFEEVVNEPVRRTVPYMELSTEGPKPGRWAVRQGAEYRHIPGGGEVGPPWAKKLILRGRYGARPNEWIEVQLTPNGVAVRSIGGVLSTIATDASEVKIVVLDAETLLPNYLSHRAVGNELARANTEHQLRSRLLGQLIRNMTQEELEDDDPQTPQLPTEPADNNPATEPKETT